jgi:uncharacterized beta-barrel protein YwiB (DUF1934 family)
MCEDLYKDVVVRIVDGQDDGAAGSELITTGRFIGNDDSYALSYTERDEELKRCETTLFVEGQDRVQMMRTGSYTTEMTMEKNKRHNCHYETPYGEFIMGVYAHEIKSRVVGGSGVLSFRYTIDFNSANASENELKIFFNEPGINSGTDAESGETED